MNDDALNYNVRSRKSNRGEPVVVDGLPINFVAPTDYNGIPFSLMCFVCDAGEDVVSPADAIREGWRGIERDDGVSWNFLGCCPTCAPGWYGPDFRQIPLGWSEA
jgi:hypothetical protein